MMYCSGRSEYFLIVGGQLVRHLLETGVDQQQALFARLQRDVRAIAHEHVDVALHGQHVDFGFREVGVLFAMALGRGPIHLGSGVAHQHTQHRGDSEDSLIHLFLPCRAL